MKRIIPKGLIVSCQAKKESPLARSEILAALAHSAELGGAAAIRADGPENIAAIKKVVSVPIIGICKVETDKGIMITPTLEKALAVAHAGATMIAFELNVYSQTEVANLIDKLHQLEIAVMADVATLEEGLVAIDAGCDAVATTLSGYREASGFASPYSPPNLDLVKELVTAAGNKAKVVAEGRYWTGTEIVKALALGAHAVVIGKGITNPEAITSKLIHDAHL